VSGWELGFLGTMALALVLMALAQMMLAREAARVARQAADALVEIRREIRPLVEKLNRIADDAARVTALALTQAERIDQVVASTAERIDETVAILHDAVISGLRAAFAVFSRRPDRPRHSHREDEDALFIG
jgi:hypothetical protein